MQKCVVLFMTYFYSLCGMLFIYLFIFRHLAIEIYKHPLFIKNDVNYFYKIRKYLTPSFFKISENFSRSKKNQPYLFLTLLASFTGTVFQLYEYKIVGTLSDIIPSTFERYFNWVTNVQFLLLLSWILKRMIIDKLPR